MVSCKLGVIYSQIFNQNSFDEGFSYDNPGLARLSFVNIFHGSRPQWSMLRYVDSGVLC